MTATGLQTHADASFGADSCARTDMKPGCDPRFLEGLRKGSEDAYRQLIDQFEGPIFRWFLAFSGNREEAEEQCADVMAAFVRALPRLEFREYGIRPILYGIARNVLRKRHALPRNEISLSELEMEAETIPAKGASIRDRLASQERLRMAMQALRQLDAVPRQIAIMRFVEDMDLQEIAEALETPLNTVKSHIRRIRQRIRDHVDEGERTPPETRRE